MGMAEVSPGDPDRPQEEQEDCDAGHMPGEPVPPPLRPIRARRVLSIDDLGAAGLCRAAELQTITKSDHALGTLSGASRGPIAASKHTTEPASTC